MCSELISGGENLISKIMNDLTGGLSSIASGSTSSFNAGPLGSIDGVLDKFGLNFTELITEFNNTFHSFKDDLSNNDLFELRPVNLPRFPDLLQIGSKHGSTKFSPKLRELLWDRLATTFTHPTYNGVKIPGLGLGETFQKYDRGVFPGKDIVQCLAYISLVLIYPSPSVEQFLPHIAVAFGYAQSFSDSAALTFDVYKLFEPRFGATLSSKLLSALQSKLSIFNRFNSTSLTGLPMALDGEIFHVDHYLPELEFALDLSPSVDFAASSFKVSDLYDSLFPTGKILSLKTFGSYVKKQVVSKIVSALNGVFDATVSIPTIGLTADEVILNGSGLALGEYTENSTQLFPPSVDVDKIDVSYCETFTSCIERETLSLIHFLLANRALHLTSIST